MDANSCCRLQGLAATSLHLPDRESSTRILMGNAMTMSVIEPLLRSALIAIGGMVVLPKDIICIR